MNLRLVLASIVLVGLAACGGGYSGSTPTSPSTGGGNNNSGTPVSIVSGAELKTTTAYAPNPVVISAGGTVTWTNNDATTHTSTSDDGAWNSGSIAPGAKFSRTFATAGSYKYHCSLHPGMIGTVTVQ